MSDAPTFAALTTAQCHALLASQQVGRLAFTFRDRVDIEPVHYVFRDDRIWGRTQFGTKVQILAHHPWVAFEVDQVEALFTWQSVVVHGRIEFPDPDGSAQEQARYAAGVAAFRSLVPEAFTPTDPTPDRDLVFMIPVHDLEGRSATTRYA
ncbi:pyridoxamine 5'-phosphate oxidase family protein [Gemmatimonas sp.]|jgi:nitroimidazol reductase NimA-like FMN-containing flavoprotein (pyridoxamine 5'-phosphate oxidase superfamily)|uniref:pyridoxamine 5'-phosphate oxidase family protein n=1 Tax=Gemmatimonas sp. TaxID=1962908 RepID=UPI0022C3BA30|nr:pyridoxamine 5'-phosphate oxidase family protein [Gemmatimonas sp.]MCZ8203585.1 pyridoxamine 5'-phosphate oxidase family protein [Gemmatimonas sp.]